MSCTAGCLMKMWSYFPCTCRRCYMDSICCSSLGSFCCPLLDCLSWLRLGSYRCLYYCYFCSCSSSPLPSSSTVPSMFLSMILLFVLSRWSLSISNSANNRFLLNACLLIIVIYKSIIIVFEFSAIGIFISRSEWFSYIDHFISSLFIVILLNIIISLIASLPIIRDHLLYEVIRVILPLILVFRW